MIINNIISIKGSLSDNVNIWFRICNKLRNRIIRRNRTMEIPIIINNFNRLDYLKQQIEWLEKAGLTNIHIIDNASTYPPLIAYYKTLPYRVYKLDKNIGHEALWRTHVFQRFMNDYYVYTDPDIVPVEECPYEILDYLLNILDNNQEYTKVALGLKIDDIPEHYGRKEEVLKWEQQFWTEEVSKGLFKARTDTTFALYRPGTMFQQWDKTLRTGSPYMARHLPWYENDNVLSEEEIFFRSVTTRISSWYKKETYIG